MASDDLLKEALIQIAVLENAIVAMLSKASPEMRSEFARAMNSTLDAKEQNPGPVADTLVVQAARLLARVMNEDGT